jgi:hypothetical protein
MSAPSFTYSGNVYTAGTAGTVDFALVSTTGNAIPYLEPSHVHVYKSANQGSTWTELTRPSQWDFVTSGTVARLASGIAAGEWVKVQRITPSSSSYVTFQPSSLLTADQLNDDTLFNTYLNQELYDQGNQSATTAAAASTAAASATATATTASTNATTALSQSNTALSQSATALSQSASALSQSSTALSNAATALSNSTTASANAAAAVTTANAADAKADSAITAISTSAVFTPVANVAAIPASPTGGQAIQVTDSTGIESFTPLSGLPGGFVGDSGLSARIQYNAATSSWVWFGYFAATPDTRYLRLSGGTLTGQLKGSSATTAATPNFSFDGDADTGLARLGANELALVTGGTARLTFDSGGNGAFTGPVTIPAGSTVAGYLDAATAASTYQTQSGMSSYLTTASASSTYQTQAAMSGYLATSAIGTTVQSYDADTAKTDVAQTFTAAQRGAYVTLTDAATIATDLSLGNQFQVTLGGNRTLGAPTNVVAGQSGVIRVVQDGTGSRTLAYNSVFKFPGGTAPTLTTTANAVDLLAYHVESTTRIAVRFIGDVK